MKTIFGSAFSRALRDCAGVAALALLLGTTALPARGQQCVGDCGDDGAVTVDEIITMVNLALTGGTEGCAKGDSNGDNAITVDEILTGVNNALTGEGCGTGGDEICGNGVTEGTEDCDDGGFCAGGEDSGTACTSDDQCAGNTGVCVGGANNLFGCTFGDNSGCPNGQCVKCRPVGGDGCAQNCTNESRVAYPYKPGVVENGGIAIVDGSGATVYGAIISVPLAFTGGGQTLTVGRSRNGEPIPVVIKASDVDLPRIPVQTIACACVRGVEAQTCGGTVFNEDGTRSPNCTPGFEMQETCPVDRPCAPIHGVGNTASGFIDCSPNAVEYSIDFTQDCNGNPGEDPFDPVVTVTQTGTDAPGSAQLIVSAAIGTVVGMCTGTAADYGPDQTFCTADDAPSTFGSPNPIPQTTGSATGRVDNPVDFPGDVVGPVTVNGHRFTCGENGTVTTSTGANMAGTFTSCDQPTIADIVVPNNFASGQ